MRATYTSESIQGGTAYLPPYFWFPHSLRVFGSSCSEINFLLYRSVLLRFEWIYTKPEKGAGLMISGFTVPFWTKGLISLKRGCQLLTNAYPPALCKST